MKIVVAITHINNACATLTRFLNPTSISIYPLTFRFLEERKFHSLALAKFVAAVDNVSESEQTRCIKEGGGWYVD